LKEANDKERKLTGEAARLAAIKVRLFVGAEYNV
jgi:hypothetical protein